MKTRESGMPEEPLWESFYRPAEILRRLQLSPDCRDVVEFGCGYGTFAVAAAQIVSGVVFAVDIEPEMIAATERRASTAGVKNIRTILRDFTVVGTGLPAGSCDYAMLFNILHAETPLLLLAEAHRVLVPGGILGVMHWNCDPRTPRGPSMEIRPTPEQCLAWARQAGFELLPPGIVDLPPYHYGMALARPRQS
jgi:SAM-dependent methyltransferase